MKKNPLLLLVSIAFLASSCSSKTKPLKRWYEYEDWWNYCSNGIKENEATADDIGKVVTLKVNNKMHKVRLIDIDYDRSFDSNTQIHTTFEFVNVISDSNGCSLAVLWNDTNYSSSANFSYLDSTIRMALLGSKNAKRCLWGEKNGTAWSETYKNSSVIDMLPVSLVSVLKKPTKYVYCKKEGNNEWINYEFHDKLFLLTPSEMGYEEANQKSINAITPYAYYSGHTELDDVIRTKNQANENELMSYKVSTVIPEGSGQAYGGVVENGAGCNELDGKIGAIYWLRSPCQDTSNSAWGIHYGGSIFQVQAVYNQAISVAPAFCI